MKKITKEAGEMDGLDDTSTDRKNTANTPASYPLAKGRIPRNIWTTPSKSSSHTIKPP